MPEQTNVLLTRREIETDSGKKSVEVYCGDITTLQQNVDVLIVSAFQDSYTPTNGSLIAALQTNCNINVYELAHKPEIDLRMTNGTWLSSPVRSPSRFGRIACIEFPWFSRSTFADPEDMELARNINSLFLLLRLARNMLCNITAIAMPLLGAGIQQIDSAIILAPLIGECVAALKENTNLQNIIFCEMNERRADLLAKAVEEAFHDEHMRLNAIKEEIISSTSREDCPKPPLPIYGDDQNFIFISYSHKDYKSVFCDLLELYMAGVRYWYDAGLEAGPAWDKAVLDRINSRNCSGIIFYLSESLFISRSIIKEVRALAEKSNDGEKTSPALEVGKNYFGVNLAGIAPSKIYNAIVKHYSDEELDQYGMDAEKLCDLFAVFPDAGVYITKEKDPSSRAHVQGLLENIRRKFNVMD